MCLLETFRGAARGASGAALRPVYGAVQAVQVTVATLCTQYTKQFQRRIC